jgi:hypothetical protein
MPRKEFEGQPLHDAGKMSDETRKALYEKDGDRVDPSREGASRHTNSPSEGGAAGNNSAGRGNSHPGKGS